MQRRYATPEPLSERVIKQLAKKFHYFDVIAKIDSKSLSIHYKKNLPPGRTQRLSPVKVAKIRQVSKPGYDGWWCKIESVCDDAPPYVHKLEGKESPREILELEVRHAAFEYEAHQLLVKEAQDVLQKEAQDVLRRNSPSNDSAR